MALTYGVRELSYFSPKSTNFLKNRDMDYCGDKQSGSSPRIRNLKYVDGVKAVVGNIMESKDY